MLISRERRKSEGHTASKVSNYKPEQLVLSSTRSNDRLDDLLDAHIAACQRSSAQRMLQDFEKAGIDEDLEQLKAGWAPSFGHHPPLSQGRKCIAEEVCLHSGLQARPSELVSQDQNEMSSLALQACAAKERLHQLASLRSYASPERDDVYSSPLHKGHLAPSRRLRSKESMNDPWDAWEQRWSQEFAQFEEFERARSSRRASRSSAAQSHGEEQWRHDIDQAKRHAEEAARKCRGTPPFTDKPKGQSSASHPRSKPSGGLGAEKPHGRRQSDSEGYFRGRPQAESKNRNERKEEQTHKNTPRTGMPASTPCKSLPPGIVQISFACYSDFDVAWRTFAAQVSRKQPLHYADIPWPTCLPSVSGVEPKDNAAERKKKLRAALVRWHPDKWGSIFDLVHDCDKASVMERVKEVTRRILEEKTMHGV